jgi:ABC-2 type transport system permease protein
VLFSCEVHKLLVSSSTYFVAAIFLATLALIYAFTLREFVLTDQDFTFVHAFLRHCWIPVLLGIPLLTMRTFSEDYRTGIIQSVKTTSVGNFSIVLAKFLAAYLFYAAIWASSLLFIFSPPLFVPAIMQNDSFFSACNLAGGYSYILLAGLLFTAVGTFFSSLTENQILSGTLSFIAIFAVFLNGPIFTSLTFSSEKSVNHALIRPLNIFNQMDNACLGVFDTRVIVLYLVLGLLFLLFTKVALEKRFS